MYFDYSLILLASINLLNNVCDDFMFYFSDLEVKLHKNILCKLFGCLAKTMLFVF